MLDLDRVRAFINSFSSDDEGKLGEIYAKALADNVPVIRRDSRDLLRVLLMEKKPDSILEIGCAVGYSALLMSECVSDARITTIELDCARVAEARSNIESMNRQDRVNVIHGDAYQVLQNMEGTELFDFAFVDAAKGQYINYLPDVLRLVKKGGMIVSDNVLQDGDILESHYTVEKRNRTIHQRMREYLYTIKNTPELETAILSVGDGMAVSIKTQEEL